MDIAEHMFTKSREVTRALPSSSIETYADLLYEMGKDFEKRKDSEQAIRWLERAYDIIEKEDPERMGPEAGELRLSIIHSLGDEANLRQTKLLLKFSSPSLHDTQDVRSARQSLGFAECA